MKYYIDCEFDGHNGPLLSLAMLREDGDSIYYEVSTNTAKDPWVLENVVPLMSKFPLYVPWAIGPEDMLGVDIRLFLDEDPADIVIIADSPVDIARFCRALSTGIDNTWAPTSYPKMTFEVHNVDCYPTTLKGAVQHNAWWDAMALREKLRDL